MLPILEHRLAMLTLVFRSNVGKYSPVIKNTIIVAAVEKHLLINAKAVPVGSLAEKQKT